MRGLVCDYCETARPFGDGVVGWLCMHRLQPQAERHGAEVMPGVFIGSPPPTAKREPGSDPLDNDEGAHFCTEECVQGWLANGRRSLRQLASEPDPKPDSPPETFDPGRLGYYPPRPVRDNPQA